MSLWRKLLAINIYLLSLLQPRYSRQRLRVFHGQCTPFSRSKAFNRHNEVLYTATEGIFTENRSDGRLSNLTRFRAKFLAYRVVELATF